MTYNKTWTEARCSKIIVLLPSKAFIAWRETRVLTLISQVLITKKDF